MALLDVAVNTRQVTYLGGSVGIVEFFTCPVCSADVEIDPAMIDGGIAQAHCKCGSVHGVRVW